MRAYTLTEPRIVLDLNDNDSPAFVPFDHPDGSIWVTELWVTPRRLTPLGLTLNPVSGMVRANAGLHQGLPLELQDLPQPLQAAVRAVLLVMATVEDVALAVAQDPGVDRSWRVLL